MSRAAAATARALGYARAVTSRALEHAFFATAIGRCAIVWSADGVAGVHLPALDDDAAGAAGAAALAARFSGSREAIAPARIARAIEAITALLAGEPRDLGFIALDLADVPEAARRVYAVARTIGPGETLTYGEVAARLGTPGAARAVGQALGRNPFPIVVPCHRVLAAGGQDGGFSAPGGVATKRRLLALEGARLAPVQLDLLGR
ncbi:MAG: methylated-DNA--[protein]-cysteine S-methyltransferase [Myxococcota bacterium]